MKRFKLLYIFLIYNLFASAQTVYYYELSNGKGDGHYITVTSKSCYDSDAKGVSLENGVRLYKGVQGNQHVFYGNSPFGSAYYYFSSDYRSLKIQVDKGNTLYYTRKIAAAGTISAHGQAPKGDGGTIPMPDISTSPYPSSGTSSTTNTTITPTAPRPCAGCGGSGMCSMCHGRGWYKNTYSGDIYQCSSCGGTGRCRVCHGKGHCN